MKVVYCIYVNSSVNFYKTRINHKSPTDYNNYDLILVYDLYEIKYFRGEFIISHVFKSVNVEHCVCVCYINN